MKPDDVPDGGVLVDTGVVSWLMRGHERAAEFRALLTGHQLAISFPTIGELYLGAEIASWGTERRAVLDMTIRSYVPMPIDDQVARQYARVAAKLWNNISGRKDNDLWTAATALAQDPPLSVATTDLNYFGKIAAEFGIVLVHPDL